MINDGSRHGFNGEAYVTSPQNMMIYTARGTTNTSGAITFPLTKFTTIYAVQAQVVRNSAAPTDATVAMVRTYSNTSVSVQCFESNTIVTLLLGGGEGMALPTVAVEVHLTVFGL